jgi:hypothetical protein
MRGTLLLVGLAVVAGCSSPPAKTGDGSQPTNADALNEVATLLRSYPAKGGKGPAKVADLARYEQGGPLGYAAVKAGDIVVVWGVPMGGEGDAGSPDIIAYEKKTPAEGGGVLLLSGEVKSMTAAGFAAAPKAGGK